MRTETEHQQLAARIVAIYGEVSKSYVVIKKRDVVISFQQANVLNLENLVAQGTVKYMIAIYFARKATH